MHRSPIDVGEQGHSFKKKKSKRIQKVRLLFFFFFQLFGIICLQEPWIRSSIFEVGNMQRFNSLLTPSGSGYMLGYKIINKWTAFPFLKRFQSPCPLKGTSDAVLDEWRDPGGFTRTSFPPSSCPKPRWLSSFNFSVPVVGRISCNLSGLGSSSALIEIKGAKEIGQEYTNFYCSSISKCRGIFRGNSDPDQLGKQPQRCFLPLLQRIAVTRSVVFCNWEVWKLKLLHNSNCGL